jgi:hypothetical protein
METKQTRENLELTFLTGFSGMLKISGSGSGKSIFRHWTIWWSIVVAVIIPAFACILKIETLNLILEIKTVMINALPNLLGFTIAGYSLMVGFIQSGMLEKITEPIKDSKFSLYQRMSSTFALNIITQALALILAVIIHFISYLDSNSKVGFRLCPSAIPTVNFIGLILISFWFAISLLMIIQIVLNIFSFSQLHHYFINKFKIEKVEECNKKSNP